MYRKFGAHGESVFTFTRRSAFLRRIVLAAFRPQRDLQSATFDRSDVNLAQPVFWDHLENSCNSSAKNILNIRAITDQIATLD